MVSRSEALGCLPFEALVVCSNALRTLPDQFGIYSGACKTRAWHTVVDKKWQGRSWWGGGKRGVGDLLFSCYRLHRGGGWLYVYTVSVRFYILGHASSVNELRVVFWECLTRSFWASVKAIFSLFMIDGEAHYIVSVFESYTCSTIWRELAARNASRNLKYCSAVIWNVFGNVLQYRGMSQVVVKVRKWFMLRLERIVRD